MRPALAAALLALTLTAAVPAHGDTLTTQVTGAGTGTVAIAGCTGDAPIAFHLDFNGLGSLNFPQDFCDGHLNAWVRDCHHEGGDIVCSGDTPVDGALRLTNEGAFHYDALYGGDVFSVDGQVAFNQAVVPAFL